MKHEAGESRRLTTAPGSSGQLRLRLSQNRSVLQSEHADLMLSLQELIAERRARFANPDAMFAELDGKEG